MRRDTRPGRRRQQPAQPRKALAACGQACARRGGKQPAFGAGEAFSRASNAHLAAPPKQLERGIDALAPGGENPHRIGERRTVLDAFQPVPQARDVDAQRASERRRVATDRNEQIIAPR
jgi:hypothetical protein